jgi:hypothetical protein
MEDATVIPGTLAAEKASHSARAPSIQVARRRDLGVRSGWLALLRGTLARRTTGLPRGFCGMIGLVVAIECSIAHFGAIRNCRSQLPLSWRKSSQAVAAPEAEATILCFGDSLVKLGVLPRVIEDCLGLSAYNLAVLGGQPASSCFLFRQVLESGHRPRAVIVDFSAPLLTMSLRANTDGWAELASLRDAVELAVDSGDLALGFSIASRWLFPSRSSDVLSRPAFAVDQQGDVVGRRVDEARVFERNWLQNRGAQVAPREFIPIEGALPEPPKQDGYRWRPRQVHTAYVARFLGLARSYGIPVFWVLPPVIPARRDRLESTGLAADYKVFVSSFVADYSGVTILDGTTLKWDTRAFRDPIHLNRDGAVAFSRAIARTLARRLHQGGSSEMMRWVLLDETFDISACAGKHDLEDLDQSRRALDLPARVASHKEESTW